MRNLIDIIKPRDNIIGMDFDPKKMLYMPESFQDCQRLIKGLSRSERKILNCHSGHNVVHNNFRIYLRDSIFVNTTKALDSLHAASGAVSDATYDNEDGACWTSSSVSYVVVTTVNYTGAYYKDVKMAYDNTASGSTISITGQWIGWNCTYDAPDYISEAVFFTASETFTIGANREHFGFWKLDLSS